MSYPLLQNLKSLSQNLNEASDMLSRQILEVESVLNDLKLGVWAWVELARYEAEISSPGSAYPMTKVEKLGYGKHQGKWGLLYCTDIPDLGDPFYTTVVPLREAPRMERIAAVDKFPALLEALESAAAEVASLARSKANEVSAFAAALKPPPTL